MWSNYFLSTFNWLITERTFRFKRCWDKHIGNTHKGKFLIMKLLLKLIVFLILKKEANFNCCLFFFVVVLFFVFFLLFLLTLFKCYFRFFTNIVFKFIFIMSSQLTTKDFFSRRQGILLSFKFSLHQIASPDLPPQLYFISLFDTSSLFQFLLPYWATLCVTENTPSQMEMRNYMPEHRVDSFLLKSKL